jgi:hypothetical protein
VFTARYALSPYIKQIRFVLKGLRRKKKKQCTYKPKVEARSRNHSFSGKAISITYSECVSVALAIQHAMRMRWIVLSSVACLAVPYFSTLSHNRHDFRGGGGRRKVVEYKMCVLTFCTNFLCNISHCKKNWPPVFLNLGSRWKWIDKFTPQPIYPLWSNPRIHWVWR